MADRAPLDAAVREAARSMLADLADRGDAAAKHALRIFDGGALGRPSIDDDRLLAEIDALEPTRGCHAVAIVARLHATGPKAIAALERRLRDKRRKRNPEEMFLRASRLAMGEK
jgi:hypothetical protein